MISKFFILFILFFLITASSAIAQPKSGLSTAGTNYRLEAEQEVPFVNILLLIDYSRWQNAGNDPKAAIWFIDMLQNELQNNGLLVIHHARGFRPSSAINPHEIGYCSVKVPSEKYPKLLTLLTDIELNKFNFRFTGAERSYFISGDSLLAKKLSEFKWTKDAVDFRQFSSFRKADYFKSHRIQPYLHIYLYGNFDELDFLQRIPLTKPSKGNNTALSPQRPVSIQKKEFFHSATEDFFLFEMTPPTPIAPIALQWLDDMLRSIFFEVNAGAHVDIYYPYSHDRINFILAVDRNSLSKAEWQMIQQKIDALRGGEEDCLRNWYQAVYLPRLKFVYDNPSMRAWNYLLSDLYFSDAVTPFEVYVDEKLPAMQIQNLANTILNGLSAMITGKL